MIRVDSRENLSPELLELLRHYPKLLDPQAGRLCSRTPVNTVASVAILPREQEIRNLCGDAIPTELAPPIQVLTDVPIKVIIKKNSIIDTGMKADNLVFKTGVGKKAGVVTSGGLAGLITEVIDDTDPQKGMGACRIWNDFNIRKGGFPNSTPVDQYGYPIDPFLENDELRESLKRIIRASYFDSYRRSEFPTVANAFIANCRQQGSPIEPEKFHFTRGI